MTTQDPRAVIPFDYHGAAVRATKNKKGIRKIRGNVACGEHIEPIIVKEEDISMRPKPMDSNSSGNLPSIISYAFEGKQCRTAFNVETNMAHVCLSDLLDAMGTTSRTNQILPEVEETFGKGCKTVIPLQTHGGIQDVIFISEPAAMFILSRGRTEVSKRLNRWLFGEVIPAIRKTGGYILNEERMTEEELTLAANHVLQRKLEQYSQLIGQQKSLIAEQQPKVEAYDQLMSMRGNYSFRNAARILGLMESYFLNMLHRDGYLTKEEFSYYHTRTRQKVTEFRNTPYAKYRRSGLFVVRMQKAPNSKWVGVQTYLTPKGLDYFRVLYCSDEKMAAAS